MQEETTNIYIVDASFILSFLLPDEITEPQTKKIFEDYQIGNVKLLSTHLLPFEVLNSINMTVLKKRIAPETANELTEIFLDQNIELKEINFLETFKTAVEKNLTVYDASYLTLSKTINLPLLTLDKKLLQITSPSH